VTREEYTFDDKRPTVEPPQAFGPQEQLLRLYRTFNCAGKMVDAILLPAKYPADEMAALIMEGADLTAYWQEIHVTSHRAAIDYFDQTTQYLRLNMIGPPIREEP
jgi:hypothetical protein